MVVEEPVESLMQMESVLMCDPDFYDVTVIGQNPYMTGKEPIHKELAIQQWSDILITLGNAGIPVNFVTPTKNATDQVFTQNQALIVGKKAILGNFKAKARQVEIPAVAEYLTSRGFEIMRCKYIFECEVLISACIPVAFFGYGIRSSKAALPCVRWVLPPNYEIVQVELISPLYYHIDLALAVLPKNRFLVYYPAFSEASRKTIKATWKRYGIPQRNVYSLSKEEADLFCANAVGLPNGTVLANAFTALLRKWLLTSGLNPIELPVSEFLKSGGSIHCLMNQMRA